MTILVLSGPEDGILAGKVSKLCRSFGAEVVLYNKEDPSRGGFLSRLESVDLLIIIWNEKLLKEYETIFSVGYCIGSNKKFALFSRGKNDAPLCNGKAVILSDQKSLRTFVLHEIETLNKIKVMKEAKKRILEMGLEIDLRDLVEAVSEGSISVVEQFLLAGFSPDSCDKNGVSLLNIAVRKGHEKIALDLIKAGADIDTVSGDRGNTPLMDAAAEGNLSLLKKLINSGAELNLKSKSGQSALILAVGRQAEDAAVLLINSGADVTLKDDLGMSAKKYAELFKLDKVLALISEETDGSSS